MKLKKYFCISSTLIIIIIFWKLLYFEKNVHQYPNEYQYTTIQENDSTIDPIKNTSTSAHIYNEGFSIGKSNSAALTRPNCCGDEDNRITVAVVCCGNRTVETLVMLKSVILLTKKKILIHIFADYINIASFHNFSSSLPPILKMRVQMVIKEAKYPKGTDEKAWKSLFRECASLRLFLPMMLANTDSLLYLDIDVILVSPVEQIWNHFDKFNSSQMAAATPEHEDPAIGWYNRFAKHPYYGRLGINSGVMLMNLTRMRTFKWTEYLAPILQEFKKVITWGDQDIINIIFHYHPDKLYIYGCEYNYRPDHCMYMSVCKSAEKNGVIALHGSRKAFQDTKYPAFKAVFQAWREYPLDGDLRQDLYYPMQKALLQTPRKRNCAKLSNLFLQNLQGLVAL